MERIKVKAVTDSFRENTMLGHAILESIGADKKGDAVFKGMKGTGDNKYMEVEFRINGVEVHFSHFVNHIERQLDRMIKATAYEKAEQELGDLGDRLHDASEEIDSAIRRIVKAKLGIDLTENEGTGRN